MNTIESDRSTVFISNSWSENYKPSTPLLSNPKDNPKDNASMTLCQALISFLTGNFYSFNQHKITFVQGETAGGAELRVRLQTEFINLAVVGALSFGSLLSQVLCFDSTYHIFGVDTSNSTFQENMTDDANLYMGFALGSLVFSMISMLLAVVNLIMINLLLDHETREYISKTSHVIRLPFQTLVMSLNLWIASAIMLLIYAVSFTVLVIMLTVTVIMGSTVILAIAYMNKALHDVGQKSMNKHIESNPKKMVLISTISADGMPETKNNQNQNMSTVISARKSRMRSASATSNSIW